MRKINTYAISLSLAMMTAGAWTFVGCSSDDNIDLGELDKTIGVGSDSFELPNSSTKNSPLGDLLELKEDGVIDTLKRDSAGYHVGDYKFTKADTVKWATPKVKQVKFKNPDPNPKDFELTITPAMETFMGTDKVFYFPNDGTGATAADPLQVGTFSFDGEGNDQIVSLSKADVNGNINLTIGVSKLNGKVRFAALDLFLPKFINIDETGYTVEHNLPAPMNDYWKLRLTDVPTDQDKVIPLKLTKLTDFAIKKNPDWTPNDPYLLFDSNGPELYGVVKMLMKLNAKDFQTGCSDTYTISTAIDLGDDMTVTRAKGYFNPKIDIDSTSTGLGDIPDFLENDEVKINLYNPSIKLTVKNNLNAKASIFGNITAQFKDGTKKRLVLPNIDVEPSTDGNEHTTTVVLCRYTPAVPEDPSFKYTPVNNPAEYKINDTLVVNDIAKILNRIPDSLKINLYANADTDYEGEIDLYAEGTEDDPNAYGMGYKIKPEYNFTSMLDLENGSVIIYNDSIQDWNKDIADNKIDLYDNAYLMVTADIHNSTPLNLYITSPRLFGLEAYPDNYPVPELRGKRMPINDAQVEIVDENDKVIKSLPVYKDGDSKNKKLRLRIKGNIEKLDGILYEVSAKAEQPTHEILNAQKHRVKIDNMKIALKGRVSIDLDK